MYKGSAIGGRMKVATVSTFRRAGFELRRVREPANAAFVENSLSISARRNAQTKGDVQVLNEKYREPVFGRLCVSDLLAKLALCIDEQDADLACVSQLTHALQVVEGMIADGVADHDFLIAGLVHDLGKVIWVTGEDQANMGGIIFPIGEFSEGIGLDQCTFQWNHGEFGYSRLKDYLPDHVSWLIRYHSLQLDVYEAFMDDRDRRYARDYKSLFSHYDCATKSLFRPPKTRIEDYSELIKEYFPDPILF
jgi:inositol oxygenase